MKFSCSGDDITGRDRQWGYPRFMSATMTVPGMTLVRGRPRDLGGFAVRRVLPEIGLRNIGPFVFVDEMGPARFLPGQGLRVRPHPHIGLATLTWLFEGAILHRDSLGICQEIRPGEVNWMTAGRGVVHSESTPPSLLASGAPLHGVQVWVALPLEHEERDPAFQHVPAPAIPCIEFPDIRATLIAGEAFGLRSPVATYSPLFYAQVDAVRGGPLPLPAEHAERAVYLIAGAARVGDTALTPGELLALPAGELPPTHLDARSRAMILGGAPLDAPRHLDWNFVSSRRERIAQAREDWQAERFPLVPGDEHERIPLP
jgi:hypothetical protein